jgi:hypothetical protein
MGEQQQVGVADRLHIVELAFHVKIAKRDGWCAAGKMRCQLWNQEIGVLSGAGVIEWTCDHQIQPVAISSRHVFHRKFAHAVVVDWRWFLKLVDGRVGRVSVDIGAAGQKHAFWSNG